MNISANMKRAARLATIAAVLAGAWFGYSRHATRSFPSDQLPEGAYARIVLAINENRPRDCFAYLETQAQWAAYTIRSFRAKAAARIEKSYPEAERAALLEQHRVEATAPDGADVWVYLAERRGYIGRLRRDLSGIRRVDVSGERATVETARATRYAFRRRENGIWGLTLFTAELLAEAEKAARDYELVEQTGLDYERAGAPAPAASP